MELHLLTRVASKNFWKKLGSFFELVVARVHWEISIIITEKQFFLTAKHSPVFVGLVFNIGTLEIFGSLKDSVVDCRRLILSRYQYRTHKATFFIRVYREIPVNISWIQVFIAVKHLQVFCRSCFNALTLEILLSREHFYVLLDWVGGPELSSLKMALSIIEREDLVDALEEFEIKRNVALLLDAFVRIRKDIPRQIRFENIEAIAGYLAKSTDDAMDKSKVRSFRKSKKNIEEVMIVLKEQIETNFSETWTNRLALLTVTAGELLFETETNNEEFASPLPGAVMCCSYEICSRVTSLHEWVRPLNGWTDLHFSGNNFCSKN